MVIEYSILQENIAKMAELAGKAGVALRPHVKAHKLPQIAHLQLAAGACGITVAKLGEAEIMAQAGIKDIFLANEVVSPRKLERLGVLARSVKLTLGVDSEYGAEILAQAAPNWLTSGQKQDVLIEVDSGLRRCGVLPGARLLELAHRIGELDSLQLKGLFTHAGHAYGARDRWELEQIAKAEGKVMAECAQDLRDQGIPVEVVSVGATPTVAWSAFIPGITEIRPGNYVFNDATQLALGVIRGQENCALRVWSTVISKPAPGRWVIDAGSKTLALDQGAHGNTGLRGFGIVLDHPELRISRLSEEHGILEGESTLRVGDLVQIVPNHACTVINLADEVEVSKADKPESWQIAARGRNR